MKIEHDTVVTLVDGDACIAIRKSGVVNVYLPSTAGETEEATHPTVLIAAFAAALSRHDPVIETMIDNLETAIGASQESK